MTNPVKARLRAGDCALGMNVRLGRSGDIARIAKTSGHDFLFIDTQHAIFDLETIAHIAQTALSIGIAPVVRVRGVDDPDVSLLLDNGVTGVVFPDVNTEAEARRAVATVRFAPLGRRSVGGGYAQFDFKPVATGETMARLNEETLLVCMIETMEGLANVEAIAAVPGVDVLHVGSNDLLADMGKPGQFDCPEIVAAQARVIAAARANGIFAGCGGNRDVARQTAAIRAGAQFVTTQTDVAFLMAAASQWTSGVRKMLAEPPR
jgi:2-keto-3-deoxy-L-rhamnonate aldolase RhmA